MPVSVGFVSYGLAAVGFLLLTLLLAVSWEGRAQGVRLILACGITAAWAALISLGSQSATLSVPMLAWRKYVTAHGLSC
jgi:hypothetical protein